MRNLSQNATGKRRFKEGHSFVTTKGTTCFEESYRSPWQESLDRTLSTKGRIIWDATPSNQTCGKERHPPALQPKHAEVARAIIWWQQKFPGVPVLLSKKDVSDAVEWVPVRSADSKLFAADLPGGAFGAEWPITIVYNSLTFGWCGAPGGPYQLISRLSRGPCHSTLTRVKKNSETH